MSSNEPSGTAPSGRKVGVVVVHGVGETDLGYAVNRLVWSLADETGTYRIEPHSEIIRLPDDEAPQALPVLKGASRKHAADEPLFRVVRRQATAKDGTRVTFDELHWADLTNLKAGRLNALLGLFRVIFESHHLVNAMLDPARDAFTAALRKLLLIAGWLMRGPLAALTIATSAVCAALLFGPVEGPVGELPVGEKFQWVQLALLAASVLLIALVARAKDVSWYDTAFWLLVVTLGFLIIERTVTLPEAVKTWPGLNETVGANCFKPASDPSAEALRAALNYDADKIAEAEANACYVNGPYRVIAYGWRLWGSLLIASVLMLIPVYVRNAGQGFRRALAPAATSIGIVILQFMLWTLIVVTVIFPMLNRAEAVKDILLVRKELVEAAVPITKGTIAKILSVPAMDLDWIGRFKFVYGSAASTLVGFVLIAAAILAWRALVAWRYRKDLFGADARMPKLLFNGALIAWLVLAVLAVITFIYQIQAGSDLFDQVKDLMLVVATGAALFAPALLLEQVSNGVHIARDLIDHQHDPKLEAGTYFMPKVFGSLDRFPRRKRVERRLEAMMANLARSGPWDRLVFVGHSQGSVVLFDYLAHQFPFVLALAREKPVLVTFGSPVASVYQRYFHEYGTADAAPSELRARLATWINLYRVDDYVGGPVSGAALPIENIPMKAGGHMDYWHEADVVRALDRVIRGQNRANG